MLNNDKIFVSDRKVSAETLGSYYHSINSRSISHDLRFKKSRFQTPHKPRRCKRCKSKLVNGIFRCPLCNYKNSDLSPSQKMDKLIAKITKDKGGFSTSNEVNANSTNQTKELINDSARETAADSSVDPAPDPVTHTGKADREFPKVNTNHEEGTNKNDIENYFTMANCPVYFDEYDSVWRCRSCGWEMEADEECIVGSCQNGHRVELRRVKGYFTAYHDREEEEEEEKERGGMELDSDPLSGADDQGVRGPD